MTDILRKFRQSGVNVWLSHSQLQELITALDETLRAKKEVLEIMRPAGATTTIPDLEESYQSLLNLRNHLSAYSERR